MGQAFMCRVATRLEKRRNEIMFKYSVCLHQSACKKGQVCFSILKATEFCFQHNKRLCDYETTERCVAQVY